MILTKGEIERLKAHPINQTELDYIDTIEAAWQEIESIKSENAIAGLRYVGELARCEAELETLKQCVRDEAIMDRW